MNKEGQPVKGVISAENLKRASHELRESGIYVTKFKSKDNPLQKEIQLLKPKIKHKDLVIFCRQLATMAKAGIPIGEAMDIMERQTKDRFFKKEIGQINEQLREGQSLSSALSRTDAFPVLFKNMVRAGESSGTLDDVLETVATNIEKEHYTVEKVKSALIYPAVIGVIAILVVIFLLWKVVPSFVDTFKSQGIVLPLPTRMVLAASHFVQNYLLWIVLGFIALIGAFKVFVSTPKGRFAFDYFLLKIPVFGMLFRKAAIARFSRTFSSLITSAVPILRSLQIVSEVVGNEVVAKNIKDSSLSLQEGRSLSGPLKASWVFPPLVTQMVEVGEKTGRLDDMMTKIADFYERDVELMVDRMKSLIEPMMIVILAVIVGSIVAAIILPTLTLYDNFLG